MQHFRDLSDVLLELRNVVFSVNEHKLRKAIMHEKRLEIAEIFKILSMLRRI